MPLLKLNTFRVRIHCLNRLINIKWQSKVTNNEVLKEVNLEIMFTLLKQRRMLWLGYFVRMNDKQIRKEQLYGAGRSQGTRPTGRH